MTDNDTADARELREKIVRLGPWHQDMEIAPGVRTGEPAPEGTYPAELGTPAMYDPDPHMEWLVRRVYPEGLAGRSVMDCGCNAGGNLFSLTRLGAGKCYGFDARDHWINQARFLAEHLPGDNIEFATHDLGSLPERRVGQFDVTLFMGLFYHLPDPITGLRIAAEHTKELLLVNTATKPGGGGDSLVLNRESVTEVMSGVNGLAWLPTSERVIRAILEWCGFPHARLLWDVEGGVKNWRRMEIIAAREASTFAQFDATAAVYAAAAAQAKPRRTGGWARRLLRRT
ncbi:MAG TPA: methyltransferase domain-containing protein [Pyrinomonadaceae bacterium]|jgi:SAM-dependent methyltransferase